MLADDPQSRSLDEGGAVSDQESTLPAAEAGYRALFDAIDVGIVILAESGIYVDVNESVCRMLKASRERLVGAHISEFVPQGSLESAQEAFEDLRTNGFFEGYFPLRALDDSVIELKWTVRANFLPGLSLCVAHDLTIQQQVALQEEAGLRLAAIVESSSDAIIGKTLDGEITSWNKGAHKIYGYAASEVIGRPISILVPPERSDEIPQILKRLKQGEQVSHFETERITKDGKRIFISLTISPIRDRSGRLIGASTIARDITNRKRAEESQRFLAEASQVLASSLDYQTTLGSVARMAVPRIADWCSVDIVEGEAVKRLAVAHVDPGKISWARQLQDIYPPDVNAERGVPKVLRSGQSEIYSIVSDEMLVAAAQDGEHLRIMQEVGFTSAMIVPLVADSRILGALTLVAAESKRQFGPTDLALAEDLGRRAAQAIEHSRLYRLAQQANQLKDEFLATVSHELRTPLTAISGYAHMLRTSGLGQADTTHALEVIERSVKAQSRLIDDILDVSRVITGKLQLKIQEITPAHAINAAIDSIRPAAESKGISLETKLDPTAGPIMGDPDRLQQIAWNLVSNAIKFTPPGGRVEARLERLDDHIQLEVTDSGIGIEPEFLPHVFERFRQADSSITRRYSGLGLGLAIARHLVELHGGTIEARSPGEGQGTSFIVRIPQTLWKASATPALPEARRKDNDARREDAESYPVLEGLRILIVDDNEETCRLLKTLFLQCLAEVRTAHSADSGLEIFRRWSPTILLFDIGMPNEDGYSLLSRIRALEETGKQKPLAAIALTGYARPEDRERALSAGFQLHMAKPVDPVELMLAVARLTKTDP